SVPSGDRKITVSYVGYQQESQSIQAEGNLITIKFKLKPIQLSEVHIIGDVAKDRETPVAFSTVSLKKVNEELASQDIPMILNSTPGVYATQSGGGDGDARITIRGFNQRNVAVMIDGIPVNDMENGWVYWSNWSGLDAVTSNIQVQRGLGASKIAIPSVGGTMNILTKGIGNKQSGTIKQDIGSFGRLKTSIGYNSGKMDNGWGFTLAGSYKKGSGFVQETWTEGYFYYAKIQKEIGNHTLTFSAMGAPQKHGQRSYKSDIATYDTTFARSLGDTSSFDGRIINQGIDYNKHWGHINRWNLNSNGDTIYNNAILNTKQNYFHKPQYSLRHFWVVNEKFYVSNISYASIGNGGGTGISGNTNNYDLFGQYNLQDAYNGNIGNTDPLYSASAYKSSTYLRSSINNHYWYGILSTANYNPSEKISISGGLDLRTYKGEHYREVYDLLGGDYAIDESNELQLTQVKNEGDIVGYHNDGLVKWLGGFGQIEYNNGRVSTFFNVSGSNSGYRRHDYFKKKDLVLSDTTFTEVLGTSVTTEIEYDTEGNIIGAHKTMVIDTFEYNGQQYTMYSDEAREALTDWKWIKGFTIKTGVNYNIDELNNVFFNIGYISKAPRFNNVFDYNNQLFRDIQNEQVKAVEGGYSYRSRFLSANLNAYYTSWINKPSNGGVIIEVDEVPYRANINGMNALHKGIEMDFAYKVSNRLTFEGLVSLGDWRWTSSDTVRFYDDDNKPVIDESGNEVIATFNAEGVHVGDAAQTQYGISLRYEPTNNSYLKVRATHFDDYYSDFDPLSLSGENAGRESWRIPAYQLIDLHAGYKFSVTPKNKLDIKFSILNLLDETYISDAQNNDPYNANYTDFDAKSAGVFFGLGRRFNISAKINF
ncbi:MAG: hypothetical protein CMD22_03340, partial [Flavobacteriales bacterium]|nr:hypothetical protein [Flavobacteriales bacterium]